MNDEMRLFLQMLCIHLQYIHLTINIFCVWYFEYLSHDTPRVCGVCLNARTRATDFALLLIYWIV